MTTQAVASQRCQPWRPVEARVLDRRHRGPGLHQQQTLPSISEQQGLGWVLINTYQPNLRLSGVRKCSRW